MSFDDSFMKAVANLESLTDEIKKQMLADSQRGHRVGQWRASLYQLRMMFDLTDSINELDKTSMS